MLQSPSMTRGANTPPRFNVEWDGRDAWRSPVQSPGEAGLPAQQGPAALSLFQSKFEYLPAWKFQSLSGWPVSELTHAHWETFSCVTNKTLPSCMPWVLVLRTARLLGTLWVYSSSFLAGETLPAWGYTPQPSSSHIFRASFSSVPTSFKLPVQLAANY